jgi:hypothetical protein
MPPSPKMQRAKNAPNPCSDSPRSVSGLEIGLTAICITLSLTFLVLEGGPFARQQGGLAAAPLQLPLVLSQR